METHTTQISPVYETPSGCAVQALPVYNTKFIAYIIDMFIDVDASSCIALFESLGNKYVMPPEDIPDTKIMIKTKNLTIKHAEVLLTYFSTNNPGMTKTILQCCEHYIDTIFPNEREIINRYLEQLMC